MPKAIHPLRVYRKKQNYTTAKVGRMLGIASSTVRAIENGNRKVTPELAIQIEKRMGIARATLRPDLWQRDEARA